MAAAKTKKTAAKKTKTAARPKPKVLLFRLADVAAARYAIPLFDLPPGSLDLGCYVLGRAHKRRVTLFEAIPEPEVPEEAAARTLALVEAVVDLLTDGAGCPLAGEDASEDYSLGFHASATYAQVAERFAADGFEVVGAAEIARAASKPRDGEASRALLARAARAMGKDADADDVAAGCVVLDEAIETWSEVEERAFHLAAEARAIGGLIATDGDEPSGVDRWGILAERLARAGFTPEAIEDTWLDGIFVEHPWPSARWFALTLLPRLDVIARRLVDRAERIEPERALIRLLIEPIEELPRGLDALYQAGVARLLAESDAGSFLGDEAWERLVEVDAKVFTRLAQERRRAPAPAAPRVTTAPRLADVNARYGVELPEEVLAIWDLACSLAPKSPCAAFADDDLLGITLVGPFDLLAGRTRVKKGLDVLLHWRYRFDPPEFFTVAVGNEDGLHFGYWFDDPAAGPACVASYYAHDAFEIDVPDRTLGAALRRAIERTHAGAIENLGDDRAHEAAYLRALGGLAHLRAKLRTVATGDRPEIGEAYLTRYDLHPLRGRAALLATPEHMGVVAPKESFQPLSLAGEELVQALRKPPKRRALVREALALAARGAPAAALLAGKICWALRLDEEAYALLDAGYAGLDRPLLRRVLALHRAHRDLASVDVLTR